MQTKSAKQIQAELEFMRRQYHARHESLNRYLSEPEPCHLAKITPYLLSAAIVISLVCWVIGVLFI